MRQTTAAKAAPRTRKPNVIRALAIRGRRADRVAADKAAEAHVTQLCRRNPYA